jgi:hypothetical protein
MGRLPGWYLARGSACSADVRKSWFVTAGFVTCKFVTGKFVTGKFVTRKFVADDACCAPQLAVTHQMHYERQQIGV